MLRSTTTRKPTVKKSASIVALTTSPIPMTSGKPITKFQELNATLILISENLDPPINSYNGFNDSLNNTTSSSMKESEIEREEEGTENDTEFPMSEEGKSIQNNTTSPPSSTPKLMSANESEDAKILIGLLGEQCFIEGDLSCESRVDLVCFGFGYIDCTRNETTTSSSSIVTKRDERSASLTKDSLIWNQNEKSCKLSQGTLKCDPWPSRLYCMGRGYCKRNEVTNEDITNDSSSGEVSFPSNLVALISIALAFFVLIGASSSYYFT